MANNKRLTALTVRHLNVTDNIRIRGELFASASLTSVHNLVYQDNSDGIAMGANNQSTIQINTSDIEVLPTSATTPLLHGTFDISCNDISCNEFSVGTFNIVDITCNDISGNKAYFTDISGVNAIFDDISCNTIHIPNFSVDDISCNDISGSTAYFTDLSGVNAHFNDISGSTAYFTDLSGVNINGVSMGTDPSENTFFGFEAMAPFWSEPLAPTTTANGAVEQGIRNVAIGSHALAANTGSYNVAVGFEALAQNNGDDNVAIGYQAFVHDISGVGNVAIGNSAFNHVSGSYNVAIGWKAGTDTTITTPITMYNNTICIGANAQPAGTTPNSVSNTIILGDHNITSFQCAQTPSSLSDKRDKKDIIDIPYGLELINNLRPRQFTWDMRGETDDNPNQGTTRIGFIAQEVLTTLGEDNVVLNMINKGNPEKLLLSYTQLIPVLTKAIQELTSKLDVIEARLTAAGL